MCFLGDEETVEPTVLRATGDVVRRDDTGNLFYEGRRDVTVKRHGMRMNLFELEQVRSVCRCIVRGHVRLFCDWLVIKTLGHVLYDNYEYHTMILQSWICVTIYFFLPSVCVLYSKDESSLYVHPVPLQQHVHVAWKASIKHVFVRVRFAAL